MHTDPTTGIPHPDRPGHWLVPPWASDSSFSAVVSHFLRFHPWRTANTVHLLTYFTGYQAALEAAPADRRTDGGSWRRRWCEDMRDCIGRCVTLYQERHAAEVRQAKAKDPEGRTQLPERRTQLPECRTRVLERRTRGLDRTAARGISAGHLDVAGRLARDVDA